MSCVTDVAADNVGLEDVEQLSGLAQISSAFGSARSSSMASVIKGRGSRPVSRMRPANTDMFEGAPPFSAATASRTCYSVRMAVTFTFTSLCERRSIRS
jgi:hypothetical protein